MTRRQANTGYRDHQWVDKQVLPVGKRFLAIEKAKNITTPYHRWPERVHASRVAEHCVWPCHPFVPAQAEQALQYHHITAGADPQVLACKGQCSRNGVFNL